MKKIIALFLLAFSLNSVAEGENTLKDVQFKDLNNNVVTLDQVTTKGKPVYVKNLGVLVPDLSCRFSRN